jgi:hypothetical protein
VVVGRRGGRGGGGGVGGEGNGTILQSAYLNLSFWEINFYITLNAVSDYYCCFLM